MNQPVVRILLVEGDEAVRAGMVFALHNAHLPVVAAATSAEATGLFQAGSFDVVVIDLHLPADAGHDMANWLWTQRRQPALVLVSTDFSGSSSSSLVAVVHCRLALLAKPFSAGQLIEAIQRVATSHEGALHA
jgi:CheY-like chemotaxis protein